MGLVTHQTSMLRLLVAKSYYTRSPQAVVNLFYLCLAVFKADVWSTETVYVKRDEENLKKKTLHNIKTGKERGKQVMSRDRKASGSD